MSSTDRSISSGFPIPQWMKSKINDRYDIDQPSFSSSETDDSFFLVRYLKQDTVPENHNNNLITKNISSEKTIQSLNKNMAPPLIVTEAPEYKGHTLACQRFITNACTDAVAAASLGENVNDPPKSLGVDDGFKTGASECGKSIVAMAHQMVSGRNRAMYKGRTSGPEEIFAVAPPPSALSKRRNSKSLPASPMSSPPGSPRSIRKNPYFTAPFVEESSAAAAAAADKNGSASWILSNLFSHRAESQEELSDREHRRMPKPSSSNNLYIKPKATELREMNFWSPTSM